MLHNCVLHCTSVATAIKWDWCCYNTRMSRFVWCVCVLAQECRCAHCLSQTGWGEHHPALRRVGVDESRCPVCFLRPHIKHCLRKSAPLGCSNPHVISSFNSFSSDLHLTCFLLTLLELLKCCKHLTKQKETFISSQRKYLHCLTWHGQ